MSDASGATDYHQYMHEDLTGKLLVASPALEDENFRRTVIYICAHGPEGAFGLVLNRPVDSAPVGDHLPAWMEHVSAPEVIFRGGPVEGTAAFGLAERRAGVPDEGWLAVSAAIGLVDLGRAPQLAGELAKVRLFSGYSGWGAGQLEGELEADAWFVVGALTDDLFSPSPDELWRSVLRRQGGDLAMLAFFPVEPGLN